MQGQAVPALVRLSNGSGDPGSPDFAPDVRGMAVGFELPDGSRTDIVSQTAPRFPVRTPDAFIELVMANDTGLARLWKLPLFLLRHREALPGLRANLPALKPPASYSACTFYAIHAFKWIGPGGERWVRYTWLPESSEPSLSTQEAKGRGRDYLQEDIAQRLASGPVRFSLQLQLAADGDRTDDPTVAWPAQRETVVAGTLELTEVEPRPEAGEAVLVFDPVRVVDGIELSDDPILHARARAYSVSAYRRLGMDVENPSTPPSR
jgi:catalase